MPVTVSLRCSCRSANRGGLECAYCACLAHNTLSSSQGHAENQQNGTPNSKAGRPTLILKHASLLCVVEGRVFYLMIRRQLRSKSKPPETLSNAAVAHKIQEESRSYKSSSKSESQDVIYVHRILCGSQNCRPAQDRQRRPQWRCFRLQSAARI